MASDTFDADFFEQKLHSLKDSQDSIQQLSAWCLERKQHHKKIVSTWLQVLKKGILNVYIDTLCDIFIQCICKNQNKNLVINIYVHIYVLKITILIIIFEIFN